MAGVGNVQVNGVTCRERRWGAGILMGGGIRGEKIKRSRKRLRQVGRGARIICNK